MSVVLGSSAENAIDLVSDDEAQASVPGLPSDAEQSAPGRTYVTRASARRAQIARDTGDEESRVVFHSTTTLPTRTLDHRTRWRGQDGQGNTSHADEGTYLAYTHAEVSGAAIASDRLFPRLNIETASLSSTIEHQHIRTSTASRGQQHSSSRTFERLSPPVTVLPNLPNGNHSGGREVNDIATQQSITAISVNIQDRNKDIVPGTEAPSTIFRHLNLPGGQSSVVPPAWEPSPNVRSSTNISRPQRDSAFDPRHVIENTQFEENWDNVLAETLHNRRTALLDMGKKAPLPTAMGPAAMRPALQNRRLRRKHSGPDLVELKGHKYLETWKKKLVQEFHIEKEMERLNAAVSLFDSRDIQTVVPNRYLKETLSSKKDRPRHARFPGRIEVLTEQPMIALRNAYSEHTAVVPNPSRLVFWTDGSAGDSRRKQTRGFAVTWRRAMNEGTWGGWEAAGFQVQGEMLNSDGMETLAVMKAIVKALELVRQTPGRVKAVAVYTDSTSTLAAIRTPRTPLGRLIIEKARVLTQLGPEISLHWCPGHSKVPGNELADKIAGMARSHVYGASREVVDLSDDEDGQ